MSDSNIEIKEEGEELDELDSNEKAEEGVAWEPSWKAETEHYFYLKSFKKPIYCQVCQSFIWGLRKQGFSCEVCSYTVHEKCISNVKHTCWTPQVIEDHDYTKSISFKHNWVPGNINMGSKCYVCTKGTQNLSGSFNSVRCTICGLTSHSGCVPSNSACNSPLSSLYFCHDLMKRSIEGYTPLLVFVNSKSGGQQGPELMRKLRHLLSAEQVVDMFAQKPVGPLPALEKYVHVPNLRILVCGGDGTACWVLSVLDKMENLPEKLPPIAMIPLGTGNDLARVLNFGGGYEGEVLKPILRSIVTQGESRILDRWNIRVEEEGGETKSYVLNNYFSIGLDAKIALKFHEMREENPQLFKSRTLNKGIYGTFGIQYCNKGNNNEEEKNIIVHPSTIKELELSLTVDGRDVDLSKYENLECIVFQNIPSYAGGTNLWGNVKEENDGEWEQCSMNDGKIEVIGLANAAHLVALQTGLKSGIRIAQGSDVIFNVNSVEVQVDGEPFKINKSRVFITLFKKSDVIYLNNKR